MISKSCGYALQVAAFLSLERERRFVPVRRISATLGISHAFLAKVVQVMTQAGLLDSYRGPTGGVSLARPAEEISVKEIIVALDGPALFEKCVLGLPGCGVEQPCPLHDQWSQVRGCLSSRLEASSVESIAARARARGGDWGAWLEEVREAAPID